MIDWPFTVVLAAMCLLILRQLYMLRTIRRLEEENFDLRFKIECMEAVTESRIPVTPFTGEKP